MPATARYTEDQRVGLSPAQKAWLRREGERRGLSAAAVLREMVQAAMVASREQQPKGPTA